MKEIAKQIAQGRKWTTRDWPAYMGYMDALPMPDGCHVVDYETLRRLDRELRRYGLAISWIEKIYSLTK